MDNKNSFLTIIGSGVLIAAMVATMIACGIIMVDPTKDPAYVKGVKDTHKEAYENGHMIKEISKDDEVIYRWKHLEKIGYEGSN